ncbi:MAG: hypothetical protein O7F17_02815 [Planctomycetota bacterium]|nr:hypothetical protein [Planctomycetota bacterium]MCZ6850553.1 hypothetical protein [Planctomycetota bacterium]
MTPFQEKFKVCYNEFSTRVHPGNGSSIMCKLHSILGADCISGHNCLGCNFNEETHSIRDYLATYAQFDYEPEAYRFYLVRLYLLVERMDVILDIIKLIGEYRYKHFALLTDVRKWANFIKHPGPFLLVHHPDYFVDGDGDFDRSCFKAVIDQEFVRKYYGSSEGGDKRKQLWKSLENASEVAVLFPDPIDLTRRFCDAIERFVEMLDTNTVHQEVLSKRSTYEAYFTREIPCVPVGSE